MRRASVRTRSGKSPGSSRSGAAAFPVYDVCEAHLELRGRGIHGAHGVRRVDVAVADHRVGAGQHARAGQVDRCRPVRHRDPGPAEGRDVESRLVALGGAGRARVVREGAQRQALGLRDAPHVTVELVESCDAPVGGVLGFDGEELAAGTLLQPVADVDERRDHDEVARPGAVPAESAVVEERAAARARQRRARDQRGGERDGRRPRSRPRSGPQRGSRRRGNGPADP